MLKEKGEKPNNDDAFEVKDPDQHLFVVKKSKNGRNDITKVDLNVKNLGESKKFWTDLAKMNEKKQNQNSCILAYNNQQVVNFFKFLF